MNDISYKDAGVDINAGDEFVSKIQDSIKSTMRKEVISAGGFASLLELPSGYDEPVLVSGTDGVGTKLKIAFASDMHHTIGIDLVAMCANDVLTCGAEPLFFLDYYACDKLVPDNAARVVEGIAAGCRMAGCALTGGETAELPGFYSKGEYDLAGFLVGVVEKKKIITGKNVKPGNSIIGLFSSGLHSNGFSLVRAVVKKTKCDLFEPVIEKDEPLFETLIKPTNIYVLPVLELGRHVTILSIAHITGGGLLENIPRTLPDKLAAHLEYSWPVPRVFTWIRKNGPVLPQEMLRTFNMGIGMTIVVDSKEAGESVKILESEGVGAMVIGEVAPMNNNRDKVTIKGYD